MLGSHYISSKSKPSIGSSGSHLTSLTLNPTIKKHLVSSPVMWEVETNKAFLQISPTLMSDYLSQLEEFLWLNFYSKSDSKVPGSLVVKGSHYITIKRYTIFLLFLTPWGFGYPQTDKQVKKDRKQHDILKETLF